MKNLFFFNFILLFALLSCKPKPIPVQSENIVQNDSLYLAQNHLLLGIDDSDSSKVADALILFAKLS